MHTEWLAELTIKQSLTEAPRERERESGNFTVFLKLTETAWKHTHTFSEGICSERYWDVLSLRKSKWNSFWLFICFSHTHVHTHTRSHIHTHTHRGVFKGFWECFFEAINTSKGGTDKAIFQHCVSSLSGLHSRNM